MRVTVICFRTPLIFETEIVVASDAWLEIEVLVSQGKTLPSIFLTTTACWHETKSECPPASASAQEILTGCPLLTERGETENDEMDGLAA